MKILVVDDDPVLLMLLRVRLEGDGHQVTTATTGAQGLAALDDDTDLVVLDVLMPDIDGLEVTRQIRYRPETADVPIVLLTGRDHSEDIVAGWQAGANYYITKPFVIEHLRYYIATLP